MRKENEMGLAGLSRCVHSRSILYHIRNLLTMNVPRITRHSKFRRRRWRNIATYNVARTFESQSASSPKGKRIRPPIITSLSFDYNSTRDLEVGCQVFMPPVRKVEIQSKMQNSATCSRLAEVDDEGCFPKSGN